MNAFARTMFPVATNVLPQHGFISGSHTMVSFRSKLAVLIAVVSIVSIANSSRVSAQTYDWTNLSEKQLTIFPEHTGKASVAISGDLAVVGNPNVNSNTGEVKLFSRVSDGGWDALATLTASDAAAHDRFGSSVGISGDTVLVGAWGERDGGWQAGSAYLFTKPEGVWATTSTHAAKLTASDAAATDYFGDHVGIDGATGRVIVGNYTSEGAGAASAYIYEAVPEPSAASLLALGLAGCILARSRCRTVRG